MKTGLDFVDIRSLAVTYYKNMHGGKMWNIDNKYHGPALKYAIQHRRVEIIEEIIKRDALHR